jgi:hypothetical protein
MFMQRAKEKYGPEAVLLNPRDLEAVAEHWVKHHDNEYSLVTERPTMDYLGRLLRKRLAEKQRQDALRLLEREEGFRLLESPDRAE